MTDRETILETWREKFTSGKHRNNLQLQSSIFDQFIDLAETAEDLAVAEEMRDEIAETKRRGLVFAKAMCPIGFFKPSWEQAQIINAWSPDFEPDVSPKGYQSVGIFSANRIGKSCAVFINTLLWLIPNDPDWVMFREHEDPALYVVEGDPSSGIRRASRGKYTIAPRPDWQLWKRTGRMVYPWKDRAPMDQCEVWHGCENDIDWAERICGKYGGKDGYLAWLPRGYMSKRSDGGEANYRQERKIVLKNGSAIMGKTYNSEDQAWAGKAVRIMNMDEGFEMSKLIESTTRVEAGGYYLWAYTPAEARNIGKRSKVAHDAYKGNVPLVGQAKFFTNFTMDDAPEHVLPAEKKQSDMARFKALGEQGRARMSGGFFESSPTVFRNFERERNILPIDGTEVLVALRGEVPHRWIETLGRIAADRMAYSFNEANIVRGMDEGLANPTACVWAAILRTGEFVVFREWEQSGLSVGERCASIIDLSDNTLELLNPDASSERRRYREKQGERGMKIRATLADSKMFKRNPESPADDWTETYRKAGLKLERASNIGPGARCDNANELFRGDTSRMHLATGLSPGCRSYVTRDCMKLIERFENYLWQQISTGQRQGEFTDKPENKDDHLIDAHGYVMASKLRWRSPHEEAGEVMRVDPLTGYVR